MIKSINKNAVNLFLISFIVLFLELFSIRFLSSTIFIVGFFTNLILVSSFLGLGVGMFWADRKPLINYFPLVLLTYFLFAFVFERVAFTAPLGTGEIFHDYYVKGVPFYFVIIFAYIINAILFIPLGQLFAKYFKCFPSLTAYSINIAGNLIGILAFSLLAYLQTPPQVWFVFLFLFLFFVIKEKRLLLPHAGILIILLLLITYWNNSFWSPYYRIDVNKISTNSNQGYVYNVNKSYHQFCFDFKDKSLLKNKTVNAFFNTYFRPYKIISPDDVLIIGAGSGNDVQAALMSGAGSVTAVEIDPFILNHGKHNHPNLPYQDPRVKAVNNDGRVFLENNQKKFDFVSFGYIDSHILFSTLSSLRLESNLYTRECFERVASHLKPAGIFSVTFGPTEEWFKGKIFQALKNTFHMPVYESTDENDFTIFITGPGLGSVNPNKLNKYFAVADYAYTPPATDNWPFAYLKDKKLSMPYIIILGFMLISPFLFLVRKGEKLKIDIPFLLMGAGFLLLETKSVSEFSLLFGSTWVVNSVVFFSILATILIVNLVVARDVVKKISPIFILLFLSLLICYFIPLRSLMFSSLIIRILSISFVVSLPIFFVAFIFPYFLKRSTNSISAFSSNLIGTVLGGVLEYTSILFDMKALYVLVFVIYLVIFVNYLSGNKLSVRI
ncbi:MAG: hypothetical protein ABIH39_00110 [Candidatus Margulisiibacteriota bacterium]